MADRSRTKFDYGSAAVGAIVAVGTTITILTIAGIERLRGLGVCEFEETGATCAREWSSVLAVIAGAATVLFLAAGQRLEEARRAADEEWRRETAILESLELRATVKGATDIAKRVSRYCQYIQTGIDHATSGNPSLGRARGILWQLRSTRLLLSSHKLDRIVSIDKRTADLVRYALIDIEIIQDQYDVGGKKTEDSDYLFGHPPITVEDAGELFASMMLDELIRDLTAFQNRVCDFDQHLSTFEIRKLLA